MKNPFTAHEKFESKPRRNAFDCSKRVYMTGKLGCLYPHVLSEVNAGDSVQIDVGMLYNFFPMVFPIQTPLRCSVYIFYGRNRIVWDSWQDFAYNNKQPDHPFILRPQGKFWMTGELADFLGVPTTYSSLGISQYYGVLRVPISVPGSIVKSNPVFFGSGLTSPLVTYSSVESFPNFNDLISVAPQLSQHDNYYYALSWNYLITADNVSKALGFSDLPASWSSVLLGNGNDSCAHFVFFIQSSDEQLDGQIFAWTHFSNFSDFSKLDLDQNAFLGIGRAVSFNLKQDFLDFVGYHPDVRLRPVLFLTHDQVQSFYPDLYDNVAPVIEGMPAWRSFVEEGLSYTKDLSELGSNPFAGTVQSPPRIPINAIPFRLYEAIYNAYFRNERNDPFMVNGEPEYNKYNTTRADGADSTPYKLYYRNWESDFLTSATQTPQQGIAPLVGINVRGDMEFLNEDGTISRIRPTIDADGHTITGVSGVVENGTPAAMRTAMELITSGISINDFRQVSSLQSWLEDNLRRGLKYRDQVLASTGVKIRYDELDMPEFLGGFSRPVTVSSITQATPSTAQDNALGDRAGQASVFGGSNHRITHYCDEAGFIMAISVIYPQPVYTQLLPKYFLKSDALSYYHPQFGSIGLQPISYKEVCPIQVFQDSGDPDATFGYQRPWYDLISAVDEAHGNMRTNMRDYLMHRTFAGIPRLGADFLHVDPKQLNDVFTITDDTEDVYQGQLNFQVYVKRAIPRFGIPRQI